MYKPFFAVTTYFSPGQLTPSIKGSTLKQKKSKFFPTKDDPTEKGGKTET